MKKSNFLLFLFILLGLIAGSIVAQLLDHVAALKFLTQSLTVAWHPKADLQVIHYDLLLQVKLNLLSIAGALGAFWLYRKL